MVYYRCGVSRTLLGQCSILILGQLSDRTIIQPISLASCSGHWHNLASKPESQERDKTWLLSGFPTSIQAVWRIFFNTVSTTPSTRGLRSWFVCCHNFFPQEGCPSPWVQDLVCLKEAALPLDLKSGLNTAWIFWSCSNNISLLYFGCAFVRWIVICFVRVTSQSD